MHQDIQNFSDITAIDTKRQLTVDLLITRHGLTKSHVTFNGLIVNVDKITVEIDLFDAIDIVINLLEFDEGTSGLEIGLAVNGLEVLPRYQHLSSNKKCYIDTKLPWTFNIPPNFYTWYHSITGQGWIA